MSSIIPNLVKLIDAGFTKDDIKRFYESKQDTPIKKVTVNSTVDNPVEMKDVKPSLYDDIEKSNEIQSIITEVRELRKLMQASNVVKDEQPQPRTIDDIFESMFADERDGKED